MFDLSKCKHVHTEIEPCGWERCRDCGKYIAAYVQDVSEAEAQNLMLTVPKDVSSFWWCEDITGDPPMWVLYEKKGEDWQKSYPNIEKGKE